jgi:predicted MFS family arabinose efflux permease
VQAICVALPIATVSTAALALSSFLVGAFVPGSVALASGRARELAPSNSSAQAAAWGLCTTAFAVGQAIAAYGFAFAYARSGDGYSMLFGVAAAALVLSLAVDLGFGRPKARAASGRSAAGSG